VTSRRVSLQRLALSLTLVPLALRAQQPAAKVARVAVLEGGLASSPTTKAFHDAFVEELAALGHKEGVNLLVDRRSAEGRVERFPALAEELVQGKPDVILAPTRLATEAVLKATRTIPIVFSNFPDPVQAGVVASLAPRRQRDRLHADHFRAHRQTS
jgi:putative ABC transport system substrate-binding protein